MTRTASALVLLGTLFFCQMSAADDASLGQWLKASVVDGATDKIIPARVYVESETGEWFFVESSSNEGSALPYREEWVPMAGSVEKHTTVSAHPFQVLLKPGRYTVTIERGKEYVPLSESIVIVADQGIEKRFRLQRWVNLAERGWFSGETHVHRRISELPNVMLAEDFERGLSRHILDHQCLC